MLKAINLHKSFGKREVVRGVTMQVERGNVVGLLGPNGAGKTTCFYMIVGLVSVGDGQIMVDEKDVTHQPVNVRSSLGVGYLPQDASIFRKLTVEENIMAILEIRRDLDAAARREQQQQLLEDLGIAHIAKQQGISLSGGERRRAEIARALAAGPRFILLDEPFAGVDPISVIEIQKIVEHLTDLDIGVLITDHNVRETLGICDHAYILNEGQVLAEGRPETIIENDEVREVYLGKHFSL
ncbi:MAG: LPS export ABC transporter ATP-binding protein [Xanthomonadales bacterium]|jgi:lipopolysaccharide export system ATP-binding protein|nr:LPS export ABC transporter ATP-binding protein [Gammaproteobacteria bacterium]MBT8063885.1 LPS export ABC transporter ATP-binding protein [Gammaproteobacteria bacterium]NNJ64302.1 LPS export ABC transporter ATP-binding protein [Xanthomonadales bacterium]NNK32364.1 LPS export ABC transporter ATP-binding protein [Xanthomonadales bacterium]NNK37831.1 LPS export ABC transporter ATP-binding protein [Xanthomonadales bacterium]